VPAALGIEVSGHGDEQKKLGGIGDDHTMSESPGTYRETDGSAVPMAEAKTAWADEARTVLEAVARVYHGLINYGELAEEVQSRSGIKTRMLMHYWIGDVLGRVSRRCHERGEPLLSALCVHQDGTIGDGYGWALADTYGGPAPDDLDMHSAEERLKCYRYFGAPLPADGGRPALAPQVATRRRESARRAKAQAPRPVCPTCHLALPATGQCDFCVL
jgi:hypothetical protein